MVRKAFWVVIALSALSYLLFALFSDVATLEVEAIRLEYLPLLFLLTSVNYLVRLTRWLFFLHITGTGIDPKRNVLIFFSGLVASITPAKAGEILKSGLMAPWHPVSRTAPLIVAERSGDIVGLSILCCIGSASVLQNSAFLLALAFLLLALALLRSGTTYSLLARMMPSSLSSHVEQVRSSFLSLLSLPGLFAAIVSSTLCWFFECLTLYFTVIMLGGSIGVADSVFIFSFSTLAGALSLVPGGLGVSEASMYLLLKNEGMPSSLASTASIMARVATLWFGVFLGGCALIVFNRKSRG